MPSSFDITLTVPSLVRMRAASIPSSDFVTSTVPPLMAMAFSALTPSSSVATVSEPPRIESQPRFYSSSLSEPNPVSVLVTLTEPETRTTRRTAAG